MIAAAALLAVLSGAPLVQAEDFVYVSGIYGTDAGQVLAKLAERLKAANLSLRHVASATLYAIDAVTLPAADAAWRKAFPRRPPARTVLLAKLPNDASVCVSVVASRKPLRPVEGGGVFTANTLFLPGLVSRDSNGDIQTQTQDIMRQQESILAAAGLTFADLTMTRIYLSETQDYSGLNEAYKRFVTAPPPARATVHARPLQPGQRVQIQSVAVLGSGEGRPSGEGITSAIHSYSVKAGRRLFITGMTGRRSDGSFDRNDTRAQVRVSVAAIEEQLRRHQMRFDDVVDVLVWLRDPSDRIAVESVIEPFFPKRKPAITVVGIPPNSPEALVEITMLGVQVR